MKFGSSGGDAFLTMFGAAGAAAVAPAGGSAEPQKRHLIAASWICSAQKGQAFMCDSLCGVKRTSSTLYLRKSSSEQSNALLLRCNVRRKAGRRQKGRGASLTLRYSLPR